MYGFYSCVNLIWFFVLFHYNSKIWQSLLLIWQLIEYIHYWIISAKLEYHNSDLSWEILWQIFYLIYKKRENSFQIGHYFHFGDFSFFVFQLSIATQQSFIEVNSNWSLSIPEMRFKYFLINNFLNERQKSRYEIKWK